MPLALTFARSLALAHSKPVHLLGLGAFVVGALFTLCLVCVELDLNDLALFGTFFELLLFILACEALPFCSSGFIVACLLLLVTLFCLGTLVVCVYLELLICLRGFLVVR